MLHACSLLTCQQKIAETLASIRGSGRNGKNYYSIYCKKNRRYRCGVHLLEFIVVSIYQIFGNFFQILLSVYLRLSTLSSTSLWPRYGWEKYFSSQGLDKIGIEIILTRDRNVKKIGKELDIIKEIDSSDSEDVNMFFETLVGYFLERIRSCE